MPANIPLIQNEVISISRQLGTESLSSEKVFDYNEKIR